MQNCPRQLAVQSCVLCSFVRCGTSKTNRKRKRKKEKKRKKVHCKLSSAGEKNDNGVTIVGISRVLREKPVGLKYNSYMWLLFRFIYP